MSFLFDLAKAHQTHEGYFPGSIAYRNNNPGNLRGIGGTFRKFATYAEGFSALVGDLFVKICNKSSAMTRYYKSKGITYEMATFLDYIHVYAPKDDGNNPKGYTQVLCKALQKYNVKPCTLLSDLARLVRGEITRIPDSSIPVIISPDVRIKGLLRRRETTTDPSLRAFIDRLIERIQKRG